MPKKSNKIRLLLSKNIKRYRAEKGLSQERLADLARIHRTYIGSIERCEYAATVDALEKIATALKVDVSKLFES